MVENSTASVKGPHRGHWPRQADIARLAGVSQATVSMVINDPKASQYPITAQTRDRVWAAVEQLSYATNSAARTLAGGRGRTLGVFTFEPVFPTGSRDFYLPFLLGIEEESERQDHDLLLFTSGSASDRSRSIYRNGSNRLRSADGSIMLGLGGDVSELQRLANEPVPVIYVGRREVPDVNVAYIGADYTGATAAVVGLMMGADHERIAYVGRGDDDLPSQDRYRGFLKAHEDIGRAVRPSQVHMAGDIESAKSLLRTIIDSEASAIIIQDGALASDLTRAALALSLRIPQDLSMAVLGDPPPEDGRDWTGFKIPRTRMGEHAVKMLIDMLNSPGDARPQHLLKCAVHTGTTIGPPKRSPVL